MASTRLRRTGSVGRRERVAKRGGVGAAVEGRQVERRLDRVIDDLAVGLGAEHGHQRAQRVEPAVEAGRTQVEQLGGLVAAPGRLARRGPHRGPGVGVAAERAVDELGGARRVRPPGRAEPGRHRGGGSAVPRRRPRRRRRPGTARARRRASRGRASRAATSATAAVLPAAERDPARAGRSARASAAIRASIDGKRSRGDGAIPRRRIRRDPRRDPRVVRRRARSGRPPCRGSDVGAWCCERSPPTQRLPGGDAEAELVAHRVEAGAAVLLGRHVARRADNPAERR